MDNIPILGRCTKGRKTNGKHKRPVHYRCFGRINCRIVRTTDYNVIGSRCGQVLDRRLRHNGEFDPAVLVWRGLPSQTQKRDRTVAGRDLLGDRTSQGYIVADSGDG